MNKREAKIRALNIISHHLNRMSGEDGTLANSIDDDTWGFEAEKIIDEMGLFVRQLDKRIEKLEQGRRRPSRKEYSIAARNEAEKNMLDNGELMDVLRGRMDEE